MEICSGHIHGRRLKPSTSKDICWGSNHPTNLKQGFKNTVLSVDIGVNSPPEEPQLCTFCQSQCEHGRIWSYSMEYNNFPQLKPCFTEQKAFGTENKVAILIIKIYTLSSDTKQIFSKIIQIPRASLSFLACVTLGCSSLTAHQDTTTHHGEKLQQWLDTEERFVKPSFNRNKSWWAQPKLWGSVMVWKLDLCPGGICSLPHVHSAGCCIAHCLWHSAVQWEMLTVLHTKHHYLRKGKCFLHSAMEQLHCPPHTADPLQPSQVPCKGMWT